jgi:MSHA biogenesis protein MshP
MKSRQKGMSLIAAVFMIVVLALLALFAVRIGGSSERDMSTELMQARALAAARSGIEYAAYRALTLTNCNSLAGFNANVSLTEDALNGFTVNVSCSGFQHGVSSWTYNVTARARRGVYGSPDYVSRTLQRTLYRP